MMNDVVVARELEFDKIDFEGVGRRVNAVSVEIRLETLKNGKPEFAASGMIWESGRRDIISGGQCFDAIKDTPIGQDPLFKEVYRLWKEHHLNDLHAGTPAQAAYLAENRDLVDKYYKETIGKYGGDRYGAQCRVLEEAGLLTVAHPDHPGGWTYGHGWLYAPIPPEDIKIINHIIKVGSLHGLGDEKMDEKALKLVLDAHKKHLDHKPGGHRADLTGEDLSGANLRGADLRRATLFEANLTNANLSGANLGDADLVAADLTDASMINTRLSSAGLRSAKLSGADLRGTDLRFADLREADLSGVNLQGADLRHSDLTGTNLTGADLTSANLEGARLTGVCINGIMFGEVETWASIYAATQGHTNESLCEGKAPAQPTLEGECNDAKAAVKAPAAAGRPIAEKESR
jgi:hypothetical protein